MHTQASRIVTLFVSQHLRGIHASRREQWAAAVNGVASGCWLSLSHLAPSP